MKLFITDYDRTLFVNENIEESAIEYINEWKKAGNIFIIATGRNRFSIQRESNKYGLKPDYIICNNGAIILDEILNPISVNDIPKENAIKVIRYIYDNYEGSVEISNENMRISIMHNTESPISYEVDKKIDIEEIENIKSIVQINKRTNDTKLASELAEKLNDIFKNYVTAYPNVNNIDIVKTGVNKVHAIDFIIKKYPNAKDIIVAGDSYNDIDMIKKYGGYAPIHAKEYIKNMAKHTFSSIEEVIKENI